MPTAVRTRLRDIPRHLRALSSLLAGIDADRFVAASTNSDPDVLARDVYPLERAYEILANYAAELASVSLETAGLETTSAPANLRRLAEAGAISKARAERMVTVLQKRNALVHAYPDVRAHTVHDAATVLEQELGPFVRELTRWLLAQTAE